MGLDAWLVFSERNPCQFRQFKVIDVEQKADLGQDIKSDLVNLLRNERFNPEYLASLAQILKWPTVKENIIAQQIPKQEKAQRGEFGETIISAILEEFHDYTIPIRKLRFKMTSGQSLPVTDALAMRLSQDNNIVEVCYVESKLRTKVDDMAAVNGCKQLQGDYQAKLPDILNFVAARLYDHKDPLYTPFCTYLLDRQDSTDKDTFHLGLCWDRSSWRERTLENLEDFALNIPRVFVHVIRISDLHETTNELFSLLGVTEVEDDDEP